MRPKLRSDFQIARLATDLRLNPGENPVAEIVAFCKRCVHAFLKEFHCSTLSELLCAAAAKLDTLFVEIHTEDDLARVVQEYTSQDERIFSTLADQLRPNVYAITFKRTRPRESDRRFISVIDCRGSKGWRSYFSKWHELAHLLTLTQQARLRFCRTHVEQEAKDPEEALMDVIAGEIGFLPELVQPHVTGEISFERIAELRESLCPDASQQASLIGFVKAWPSPCLLIQARLGLRDGERRALSQQAFDFHDGPTPVLRAVHVTANSAAERTGALIPRNMRIPERSAIFKVFSDGLETLEADENLAWWESSTGRGLDAQSVKVLARRRWDSVDALILPH
jgi:hypothetical protein